MLRERTHPAAEFQTGPSAQWLIPFVLNGWTDTQLGGRGNLQSSEEIRTLDAAIVI